MRAPLVLGVFSLLAALSLSGCTQGSPGGDDDWFGKPSCPSWLRGLDRFTGYGPGWFNPAGTNTESKDGGLGGRLNLNDSPLDQVEIAIQSRVDSYVDPETNETVEYTIPALAVEKGVLHLSAVRNDTQEPLKIYDASKGPPGERNPAQDVLSWEPGTYDNFTLKVDLADALAGDGADPTTVDLVWVLLGPRPGPGQEQNAAWAVRGQLSAIGWYRTCNADGSDA